MTVYVILVFLGILIGMAISVSAFGTGGKRANIIKDIYFSVEEVDGIGILYSKTGTILPSLKFIIQSRNIQRRRTVTIAILICSQIYARHWGKVISYRNRTFS